MAATTEVGAGMGDGQALSRLGGLAGVFAIVAGLAAPADAQDVRGLEVCTAEKQMERRTSCLQSNVELLQRTLTRFTRETQDKSAAANRELAAAKAEIASLKAALEKIRSELAGLKRATAETTKNGKTPR